MYILTPQNVSIDCATISGPQTGLPCKFPFIYKGVTYTQGGC